MPGTPLDSGWREPIFVAVLPYPHVRSDEYKAALCARENAVVRKKPECWTCSWCVTGSDTMVSAAPEASHCKLMQLPMRRNQQESGTTTRRAA
jgi:hypothetical protein